MYLMSLNDYWNYKMVATVYTDCFNYLFITFILPLFIFSSASTLVSVTPRRVFICFARTSLASTVNFSSSERDENDKPHEFSHYV